MLRGILLFGIVILLLYVGALFSVLAYPALHSASADGSFQTCGLVENTAQLGYPVDPDRFTLVNPFGRPNPRFDGRLHTGDDWILAEGESLGQPVFAVAPGRVTYSNPTGWGRDKGVVIVEHVFVDGSVLYSLYGHIEESETVQFPAGGSCVNRGDVLGLIGDPRPAPHLHFEIRSFDPAVPGPGYWPVDPTLQGWLNPSQFLENRRAWLHPAYRWHIVAGDANGVNPPPLQLSDGALVFVDGVMLKYVSAEGIVLRQFRLADSVDAVGLVRLDDQQVMAVEDGRLLWFEQNTGLVQSLESGLSGIAAGPWLVGENLILYDQEGNWHLYDPIQQRLQSLDVFGEAQRIAIHQEALAILTVDNRLHVIGANGTLWYEAALLPNSDVISGPGNRFLVRDQGRLYWIAPDMTSPETILEDFSVNRSDSRMVINGDQIILWGVGGPARMMALDFNGQILWETDLFEASYNLARAEIRQVGMCTTALATPYGSIILIDSRTGQMLSRLNVWGQSRNNVWLAPHAPQGTFIVQVADQFIGYDLAVLSATSFAGCPQ